MTVVLHMMAALHDLARQLCIALHPHADAKEGRLRAVLCELRQHLRGHVGIRPVVDGDGDSSRCAGLRRHAGPVRTQQLAARPESGGGEAGVVQHHGAERPRPRARPHQQRRCRSQMHGGGCVQQR